MIDEKNLKCFEQLPLLPLDSICDVYVEHVVKATGGQKGKAAKILGVDRKTLYRYLKRIKLQKQTQENSECEHNIPRSNACAVCSENVDRGEHGQ